MTVQELINELQALIAEDPTIAELDVYAWTETQEAYDAEQAGDDWVSDEGQFADGAVVGVVVPEEIAKNGESLGSYVAIRAVFLEEGSEDKDSDASIAMSA